MGTGYSRNDTVNNIASGKRANAADIDGEFDALEAAFDESTGHTHDGTADEGAYVPLIADSDAKNKVVVDTSNNRVGVFVEVAAAATEQVRVQDGAVVPVTDDDVDLGAVGQKFKDLYIDGVAYIDDIQGLLTGNVTGNLTGNVTAASGDSTFNNITVNGTADFTNTSLVNVSDPTSAQEAATKNYVDTADTLKLNLSGGTMSGSIAMGTNQITGLGDPTLAQDAATKNYVDTTVSAVIDSAPGALDTLNELAAALGDDANFSTTVTTSIATKVSKSGDTMSGNLAMGTNKVTGLGDPTSAQDAATKTYVDTADALKLNLAGGTMSGPIAMGGSKITGLGTPTTGTDATTKSYVDGILGSATAAADSAAAAAVSEANAAASYDSFDDRYLGAKASEPTLDNDGDALIEGAIYWNSTDDKLKVYDGAAWNDAAFDVSGLDLDVLTLSVPANTTISAFGASLVDDADAATARTTLGLGTAATTASTAYATAAQGALADSALQPGDDADALGSGAATDGQVLTADGAGGAAWEDAAGGGGFTPIATTSVSSAVGFVGFSLSSSYDVFRLYFNELIPAVTGALVIQTSTDGGSTFNIGASDYQYSYARNGGARVSDLTNNTILLETPISNDTSRLGVSGVLEIWLSDTKSATFSHQSIDYDNISWGLGKDVTGVRPNYFKIFFDSGNTNSGELILFGMSK